MSYFGRERREGGYRGDYNNNYNSFRKQSGIKRDYNSAAIRKFEEESIEYKANAFSRFFKRPSPYDNKNRGGKWDYTHRDAIKFADKSREWALYFEERRVLEPAGDDESIQCISEFDPDRCIGAYYRLISQQDDKYILMAKHTNMHGFHRGDLRFVEVNARTVTKGFERFSVIGKLYLGDEIVVTKLAKIANKPLDPPKALTVHHNSKMFWEVAEMRVVERKLEKNVVFAFMKNGSAIVKGKIEAAAVHINKNEPIDLESIYIGSIFTATQRSSKHTGDRRPPGKSWKITAKIYKKLDAYCDRFSTYPTPLATIYDYKMCPKLTKRFQIGYDALKDGDTYEAMEIIELCTQMGQSAVSTVSDGRTDSRMFQMLDPVKRGNGVRFSISNSYEGRWNSSNRIQIQGPSGGEIDATIETIKADQTNKGLQIFAKISKKCLERINFCKGTFIVYQRAAKKSMFGEEYRPTQVSGLYPWLNGRRIIETLYGGPSLQEEASITDTAPKCIFPIDPPVEFNQFQNQYVSLMTSGDHPLILGSSPFGCGKSMTIMMAAIKTFESNKSSQQLLITQSNYASVNLIDIARKLPESEMKILRYVGASNDLPEQCRTDYDFPVLIESVFKKVVTGEIEFDREYYDERKDEESVLSWLVDMRIVELESLGERFRDFREKYERNKKKGGKKGYYIDRRSVTIVRIFLELYKPNVIVTTADSLNVLKTRLNAFKNVVMIQIDEACQLPECTLLSLLRSFPDANYGLIGDIKQLPPFCEEKLKGKLKDYGVGNTMERAIEKKMFPEAIFRYVYRCHPKITELLSELFYDGNLISGVKENERNEFMRKRPDFWPNLHYPIILVDNQEEAYKIGTSCGNVTEKILAKQIVKDLLKDKDGYQLKPSDIGVISFYSGQTEILSKALSRTEVKCGTVDAFQGSEKEVIILCCTNERISEFMQLSNRLNVAMSRAKQATIIIGNSIGLSEAKYWKDIIKKVEEHDCVADTTKLPFYVSTEQRDGEKEEIVLETDEDEEDDEIETDFEIDFENLFIFETPESETPSGQQDNENQEELTTTPTASTPNTTEPTN
ncbi:hypothetical protein B9Z55_012890 [Caenorhabditis nigoni]|uniref:DNA2/NAM7 helicase-like C-terminal domain-containing protein n=1 Tax=Caenorhabditis nigoni TaxID=1611254 RepID=A0A2G5TZD2_9PELO|nr:hypothetical protein B9Z55_012890 [Caenorhabditis nigoni]